MGNFALQKGPGNFLKLRISPWGNPFLLLLLLGSLFLSLVETPPSPLSPPYLPPSACCRPAWERRRWRRQASGGRGPGVARSAGAAAARLGARASGARVSAGGWRQRLRRTAAAQASAGAVGGAGTEAGTSGRGVERAWAVGVRGAERVRASAVPGSGVGGVCRCGAGELGEQRPDRRPQARFGRSRLERSRCAARVGPGAERRRRVGAHERVQCTAVRLVRLRRAKARHARRGRKRELAARASSERARGGDAEQRAAQARKLERAAPSAWWRGRRGDEAHEARARADATRQGRSKRGTGNGRKRRSCAGQRRAIARRAGQRCAGKSHAVREELQCGGCERIRTGAAGPRVENIGGRRGEGNG
jgi:hypothetical protein